MDIREAIMPKLLEKLPQDVAIEELETVLDRATQILLNPPEDNPLMDPSMDPPTRLSEAHRLACEEAFARHP